MLKKIVKYSLAILALLTVVLVAAPLFIDVNNYKPQITEAVEDATGRTLQIGNIEASLFPWIGVRLTDVRLANRAGFSDRDFLKVESLDIQVAFLPLLSKELEIKQFTLDAPELFLESNAAGEGNWEGLVSSTPSGSTPSDPDQPDTSSPATGKEMTSKPSTALAALNAESLRLNRGRFIWLDHTTDGRMDISDVNVEINDVQTDRPIEIKASLKVGSDEVNLSAQVGPIGDISKLDVEKLPLQASLQSQSIGLKSFARWLPELPEIFGRIEDAKLQLNLQLEQRPDGIRLTSGEATLLAATSAAVNWKVEMPSAEKVQLQSVDIVVNEKELLNMQGEVRLGSKPNYKLRIKSERLQRTWLASLLPELNTMYAAHPSPWKELKLGALIVGDATRLELRDIQLMLDKDIVQISGVASFDKAPDIRLRLTSSELHLDPWLPQPKTQKPAPASVESELATVSKEQSQEPDLRFLKPWRISSQMQIEKLHLRGLEMGQFRASLNGNNGLFKMDPLRFDLAGGQVTERATLNVATYPAKWTESVRLSGVNIGPILKALADMDMLEGILQMETNIKATGLLPENSMKSLSGKGSLLLRDGSVKGLDIAGTLRSLTSPGMDSGPKKTDFAQLSGSFVINKGLVKNSDLFMASPLFRLTGQGQVDLPKGSMDYRVKPRLVGTLTGQGDTVTVRKGLSVPLRIRGPFTSLKVTPEVDPATLIENIGAIKGGAAGGILKGLKESISDGGQQPGKPAGDEKPSIEKEAQKALKGLLGF